MSFDDGWTAINLDMPKRVPRTEYSAEQHFELVKAVTGLDVHAKSTDEVKAEAAKAFYQAWNYDWYNGAIINSPELASCHTSMGHAEYAADGSDYNNEVYCPFNNPEDVFSFDPWQAYGEKNHTELIARFEADYKMVRECRPDGVNMTGTYVTLMSGLIDIFGWDMLLLSAGTDMERFGQLTNRYASWMQQYFDALACADVPVVMVHDDIVWTSGAFMPPQWYRKYIFPNYKKLFTPLHESGKKIMYISDGDFTEFVDDIAECGVHGFVMEPCTDMGYIAEKYGKTHVFVGNADTRILLSGTKEQIRGEVERCMSIGKNCPGFFMAVGNHIPPNTPVENAIYYNEVYKELGQR